MKKFLMLSFAMIAILGSLGCNAQDAPKAITPNEVSTKVEVYYFHFSRRCTTCQSVEKTAKEAVSTLYADKVKTGEYTFKELNLEDESTKALAEKLGVGGQALLVVCGKNKVDITSQGFMNAHNPAKMQAEIKKAVEKVTKG